MASCNSTVGGNEKLITSWQTLIAQLVEQCTNDPKFKGLHPASVGTNQKYQRKVDNSLASGDGTVTTKTN